MVSRLCPGLAAIAVLALASEARAEEAPPPSPLALQLSIGPGVTHVSGRPENPYGNVYSTDAESTWSAHVAMEVGYRPVPGVTFHAYGRGNVFDAWIAVGPGITLHAVPEGLWGAASVWFASNKADYAGVDVRGGKLWETSDRWWTGLGVSLSRGGPRSDDGWDAVLQASFLLTAVSR